MSSIIWTPDALSSNRRQYSCDVWRFVEAQNKKSTRKLVANDREHDILEALIDADKPPLDSQRWQGFNYLLFTPFRYPSPQPTGSRFRPPGAPEGVFYAAEAVDTAFAEIAFHRLRVFIEAPETAFPAKPIELTAFSVPVRTDYSLDLTIAPLVADESLWTHPVDYRPCQDLAQTAREAAINLIRYRSVRDPKGGMNVALLNEVPFASKVPQASQTWQVTLSATGVDGYCETTRKTHRLTHQDFSADPRFAGT